MHKALPWIVGGGLLLVTGVALAKRRKAPVASGGGGAAGAVGGSAPGGGRAPAPPLPKVVPGSAPSFVNSFTGVPTPLPGDPRQMVLLQAATDTQGTQALTPVAFLGVTVADGDPLAGFDVVVTEVIAMPGATVPFSVGQTIAQVPLDELTDAPLPAAA